MSFTSSLTTTPPVSSAWFHVSPNAPRLIVPVAVKPARRPPHGSVVSAFGARVEHDLVAHAADRQVAGEREGAVEVALRPRGS